MDTVRMINGKLLRRGYTTGSCAAAAAKAAAVMLLTQSINHTVIIKTPNDTVLALDVLNARYTSDWASCAIQKDGGDDPDVTDGVLVYARVSRAATGLTITGGDGIGRVIKFNIVRHWLPLRNIDGVIGRDNFHNSHAHRVVRAQHPVGKRGARCTVGRARGGDII